MKLLFVQKEGGIFGAESYQLNVIPALMAKGVEIHFLRLYTDYQGGKGGDFVDRLKAMSVTVFEINIGRYPSYGKLKAIRQVVKAGNYDLVHTHLIHADFYLAMVKTLMMRRLKLVSTKHGYDNDFTSKFGFDATKQTNTPYFLISRWAEARMNRSFTISHGLRDFFIATGLTKAEKMSMIHYGFDLQEIGDGMDSKAHRKAAQQLVIAGRLIKFKGHEYVIKALPLLKDKFSDLKLLLIGIGEHEDYLKALVKKLGLEEQVIFLGYSKEVQKYMYNSDVVLVPSVSEGFGVVFLEAFNCRTPVIAFDVPAGNELMTHGEQGFLVSPYEVQDMAAQIESVLSAPDKSRAVAENAYGKLKTYFTIDRMVEETITFYEQALKEK